MCPFLAFCGNDVASVSRLWLVIALDCWGGGEERRFVARYREPGAGRWFVPGGYENFVFDNNG